MLYLLESTNYFKIGYTTNIKSRLSTYKTHNPDIKLIQTKDGTKNDEKILHKICEKYRFNNEWFHKNDIVMNSFLNYTTQVWDQLTEIEIKLKNKINNVINDLDKITNSEKYYIDIRDYEINKFFSEVKDMNKPELYEKIYKLYSDLNNLSRLTEPYEIIWYLFKYNYINKENAIKYIQQLLSNIPNISQKNIKRDEEIIEKSNTAIQIAKEHIELAKQYETYVTKYCQLYLNSLNN